MADSWNVRVTDRRGRARVIPLQTFPVVIGRDESLAICIDDPQASRKHAQIDAGDANSLRIADLSSTNGTYLNGRKISRANAANGDRVKIGETIIEITKVADVQVDEDTGARKLAVLKSFASPSQKASPIQKIDGKAAILSRIGSDAGASGSASQQRLTFLADIARILTEPMERDELFKVILAGLLEVYPIDRAAVLLKKDENSLLEPAVARSKEGATMGLVVSRTICQHVYSTMESIITEDAVADPRFASGDSIIENRIGSVICVPLSARGQICGVMYASTQERATRFTDQDLSFMALIGNLLALVILLDSATRPA